VRVKGGGEDLALEDREGGGARTCWQSRGGGWGVRKKEGVQFLVGKGGKAVLVTSLRPWGGGGRDRGRGEWIPKGKNNQFTDNGESNLTGGGKKGRFLDKQPWELETEKREGDWWRGGKERKKKKRIQGKEKKKGAFWVPDLKNRQGGEREKRCGLTYQQKGGGGAFPQEKRGKRAAFRVGGEKPYLQERGKKGNPRRKIIRRKKKSLFIPREREGEGKERGKNLLFFFLAVPNPRGRPGGEESKPPKTKKSPFFFLIG